MRCIPISKLIDAKNKQQIMQIHEAMYNMIYGIYTILYKVH